MERMKPTTRTTRIIHHAFVSHIIGALVVTLLAVALIMTVSGQPSAPFTPQNPPASSSPPQPNAPPSSPNQDPRQNPQPNPPPAPNPGQQNPPPPNPTAPAVPFAPPQAPSPSPATAPLALGDVVTQAIAQASSFQQARIEELI